MALFSRRFLWLWFLFFCLIAVIQVVPLIYQESPTNDEPIELTNGYFAWQGDLQTHHRHPPLAILVQSAPLRFMGLRDTIPPDIHDVGSRAYYFFHVLNPSRFEAMVQAGRWMTLLWALALGYLLYRTVREKEFLVAFAALFLWAFEPALLAYAGLGLADLPLAFFFFLAVLCFERYIKAPSLPKAFGVGLTVGATICTKFSGLALVPLLVLLDLLERKDPVPLSVRLRHWSTGLLGSFIVVGLIYLPGTFALSDHQLPWTYFERGLRDLIDYSAAHHPTYFCGLASRENHWLYFPVSFLLKTPLPFLFLLFAALGLFLFQGHRFAFCLWVPPLFFFACILPVQNLGIRYLLPSFPFFILLAAETAGWLARARWSFLPKTTGPLLWAALLMLEAASAWSALPNAVGYFNVLIPAKDRSFYLGDNDLDIGQDVKRLAQVGKERGWKNVRLAQFGGAVDLSFYGIPVQSWTQKDLKAPQPGQVYAVNVTLLQIGPLFWPNLEPIARGWVSRTVPTGKVGDSWAYFEIPGVSSPDHSSPLNSIRDF